MSSSSSFSFERAFFFSTNTFDFERDFVPRFGREGVRDFFFNEILDSLFFCLFEINL